MKHQKKIFIGVIIVIILAASVVPLVNYFVDPFGAFAKENFWYSYSMTRNPRTAKISYIASHEGFDGYVVGSSGSSALVVEQLNKATGENFYNAFFYGAYMPDIEKTIYYLIDEKEAKHIIFPISFSFAEKIKHVTTKDNVLNVRASGEDYFQYYTDFLLNDLRYSIEKIEKNKKRPVFTDTNAVFIEETGNYDKRKRDVESIISLESYLKEYPEFNDERVTIEMTKMDNFFEGLERVLNYCDDKGVKLDIVMYPIYEKSLHAYEQQEVDEFYSRLSGLTDFWDFTVSDISYDPRLFYDTKHYRNSVGNMMIAKMYGIDEQYIPESFGQFVKKGETHSINVDDFALDESMQTKLEIFIVHSVEEGVDNDVAITPKKLEEFLIYLEENKYNTVSQKEILDYVNKGIALPKKPVLLTFDDGYYNNYEKAFPLLQKYKAKAIFCPIGVSIGKEEYRHTDIGIKRHYGYDEIDEMLESGLIEIGSHSYDLHRVAQLENNEERVREDMLKFKYETLESYVNDMELDFKYFRGKWKRYNNVPLLTFSYPHGKHDEYTDMIVAKNGFKITLTSGLADNYLVKGFPQSMLGLERIAVSEDLDFDYAFGDYKEDNKEK